MAEISDGRPRLDDIDSVVDADFHLTESQDDVLPYLEAPFDSIVDQTLSDSYLNSFYPSSGHLRPTDKGNIEMEGVRTPEDVRAGMELLGIDEVVLTPGQQLTLGAAHHDELAAGLATAYNSWLLDTVLDPDPGIHGALVVAPQRPEAAAAEIDRRADESQLAGVMIPSGGVSPPLGHERYVPIYEAAESHGLPVMLHAAIPVAIATFPTQWRATKRYLDMHVPYHPAEQSWHVTSMLTNGIPARFPDLKVVVQESGVGWVPYLMRRYDDEYAMLDDDAPLLDKRPSDYVREQFYFTSQPTEGADEPSYLCPVVRAFDGADTLLFSSDYPHYDFDYTDTLLSTLSVEFDAEEIAAIYGGNATEAFDL